MFSPLQLPHIQKCGTGIWAKTAGQPGLLTIPSAVGEIPEIETNTRVIINGPVLVLSIVLWFVSQRSIKANTYIGMGVITPETSTGYFGYFLATSWLAKVEGRVKRCDANFTIID